MVSPVARFLEAHPFVRLVCPLMVGIAVADVGDGFCQIPYLCILFALILAGGLLFVVYWKHKIWDRRAWFGTLSFLFFFILGFACCSHHWRLIEIDWPDEACVYEGRLTEEVTPKKNSYLCPLRLTSRWQADTCRTMDALVLLYLPKDSVVADLLPGQKVRFYGKIETPNNLSPEFDYVRYLHHRHVNGTLYTRRWQLVDSAVMGWKAKALLLRERLREYYAQAGMEGDEGAVLSALTLGYKAELSEEVRQLYNVSGASHVLALSGLHIGVLCAVLAFLFSLILPGKRFYLWRRIFVIPVIWGFVLMVGLPVSAVRAAIMFSLLIVGSCFTRVGFSLNTLALTAFGMLCYNPFYLMDVGFQMSFCAVASLLLLQPWLEGLLPRPRYAVVRYLWSLTTVSIAAQVGVLPLILFYFSRVSPYALLVNLWVVPLTFVIVCLSVPFVLLYFLPWPGLQVGMAWLLGHAISFMNEGVAICNCLPGADVSGISISVCGVISLYMAIALLILATKYSRLRFVVWSLVCLCIGAFCQFFV